MKVTLGETFHCGIRTCDLFVCLCTCTVYILMFCLTCRMDFSCYFYSVSQIPNRKGSEKAVQSIIGEVFDGVSFEEFEVGG